MREIKFRAWADNSFGKGMHYGWGCYTNNSNKQFLITDDDRIMASALMQFTGLKDKNGKEIYEGDIVKFNPIGSAGTEITEIKNMGWYIEPFQRCYGMVEIIGNIYENPELLSPPTSS